MSLWHKFLFSEMDLAEGSRCAPLDVLVYCTVHRREPVQPHVQVCWCTIESVEDHSNSPGDQTYWDAVSAPWRDTCLHLSSLFLAPTDPAAPSSARELSMTSQFKKLQETIEQKTKIELGDVIHVRGYVRMFREQREIGATLYCKHGEFLPSELLCKCLFSSKSDLQRCKSSGEIVFSMLFLGNQHF